LSTDVSEVRTASIIRDDHPFINFFNTLPFILQDNELTAVHILIENILV
jgi:hypothetical protein